MSIIRLLFNNLQGGSITLPYPERPPIQSDYRGMVQNAPEQCTGCGLLGGMTAAFFFFFTS